MNMVHVTIQTSGFAEEISFYEKFDGLKIQRDMRLVGKDLVFLGDNETSTMIEKKARTWEDFGLEAGVPIYTQFQEDKDRFMFVADPKRYQNMWKGFEP